MNCFARKKWISWKCKSHWVRGPVPRIRDSEHKMGTVTRGNARYFRECCISSCIGKTVFFRYMNMDFQRGFGSESFNA
uniref:Uncharacterized protein n=1 Tax=Candidatus Kentrum sp. MB TaxID=2138164 RepID=A0A450XY62_9GAMM|nr:MAG: hypothetical protein BECKMB1821G_GA0114241_106114 [Candidatus Kentron sp. MB]VFK34177.1 MAG: hypothetical protein BECKMB1821I_GA0114274_106314 [Candidatus Kentron sp. MB]VFK76723.1 MAG: hypothetical protein BECKMB1821H_GA0114242_10716 [Candidatus Kentron sp. MB]